MDERCDNLRLICDLDSTKLGILQTIFDEQKIKISGQLQIPISSTQFNNLMLLDCSRQSLKVSPFFCSKVEILVRNRNVAKTNVLIEIFDRNRNFIF